MSVIMESICPEKREKGCNMITHKYITKIVGVIMAVAVFVCILAAGYGREAAQASGAAATIMRYETELFDTDRMIQVDIRMEEEDWEDMLAGAMEEEYHVCDIVINGEKIYNVGIRPKGNTSLSAIAMNPDTDRFSLKLEFDHYMEGQTCFGLDKLILNNNYADATSMKEAFVYDMYQYLGADASLYNYAEVSVNGVYWGVYLALEAVEESFLMRNYGTRDGKLYKPEGMDMGGRAPGREGMDMPERGDKPEGMDMFEKGDKPEGMGMRERKGMPEGMEIPEGGGMPEGGLPEGMEIPERGGMPGEEGIPGREEAQGFGHPGGDFLSGSGGANLNYMDDDPDSYRKIWEGEVTDTDGKDHKRVVAALKGIEEGMDLEKYMDIDNILKYMAVHTFSVNQDSLSGNMAHNYYLYEYDGKLNILPWDYNLAFGGMGVGTGASSVVNDAIDTPFQGTDFFDGLLENEEYLSRYHGYLEELTQEYVFGGRFEEVYDRIRSQIDGLVETDPTAFYSYEEYEAGAEMFYQTVILRAESIQGQLDGRIPATDEEQREDDAALVDASELDMSVMGVFEMGGRK